MSRIEPIKDVDDADLAARELIYFADKEGAPDPRVVRIFGRTPAGSTWMNAWRTVFHTGVLPHRLKELMRLNMSLVEQCGYCSSVRSVRARREGVTDELAFELADYENSAAFSETEKAALRFGDRWKEDSVDDDEVYEDLRKHFNEEEIVELGVVCCFMESGRFVRSLQIVTWDEACAIDPVVKRRVATTVS